MPVLDGGRGAAEGDRATGLGLQRERGGFQHMGQRDRTLASRSGCNRRWPETARAAAARSRAGRRWSARRRWQDTMASMAVCRLQRLGPRRARMRETSIGRFLSVLACCRDQLAANSSRCSDECGCRSASKVSMPAAIRSGGDVQRPGRGDWPPECRRRSGGRRCVARPSVAGCPGWPARLRCCRCASTTWPCRTNTARPPAARCGHDGGRLQVVRIENHFAIAQRRPGRPPRIGGVEHGHAVGQHHIDLGAQHLDHLVGVDDVELGQRLGAVQVGHDADLAAVVGQAVAQDGCGAVFDHGGLHARFISRRWPASQSALSRASTRRRSRNRPSRQARPT